MTCVCHSVSDFLSRETNPQILNLLHSLLYTPLDRQLSNPPSWHKIRGLLCRRQPTTARCDGNAYFSSIPKQPSSLSSSSSSSLINARPLTRQTNPLRFRRRRRVYEHLSSAVNIDLSSAGIVSDWPILLSDMVIWTSDRMHWLLYIYSQ